MKEDELKSEVVGSLPNLYLFPRPMLPAQFVISGFPSFSRHTTGCLLRASSSRALFAAYSRIKYF